MNLIITNLIIIIVGTLFGFLIVKSILWCENYSIRKYRMEKFNNFIYSLEETRCNRIK